MIPNSINTLVGIWLVYAVVLNPAELGRHLTVLMLSGLIVLVLAIWAYREDYLKWPATTEAVLGAGLAFYAGFWVAEPRLVTFWVVLFVGIAVAIVSLWSALYRAASAPEYELGEGSPRVPAEEHR